MRNFLRNPLTWLVVAEFVVVGAVIVLAWSAIASAARPALASPSLQAPDTESATADSQLPELGTNGMPRTGPRPGLNVDPYFWSSRLAQLNEEQVFFEQLEWRVVHSALTAAERYVQAVVVPSILRAEGART